MAIRLHDKYESHGFFRQVRDELAELGRHSPEHIDWDIMIQPLTTSEARSHELEDGEDAFRYKFEEKQLIFSVARRDDNFVSEEPAGFAQNIFDFIDMLYDDDDDLDGEDADF